MRPNLGHILLCFILLLCDPIKKCADLFQIGIVQRAQALTDGIVWSILCTQRREEVNRGHVEIGNDIEQFLYRGHSCPTGDPPDIGAALVQIQAHFVFGYILLNPQLGNTGTHKFYIFGVRPNTPAPFLIILVRI